MNIFIILPGHLFEQLDNLMNYDVIYIVEEYLNDELDNPIRTKYFRDCLKFYYQYLKKELVDKKINYVKGLSKINLKKSDHIGFYDPVNHDIEIQLKKLCTQYTMFETYGFITSKKELIEYHQKKKTLRQTSFYQYQRYKLKILLDTHNKLLGDKLTFDTENRNPLNPSDPIITTPNTTFATNFADSKKWLRIFIQKRLNKFGDYQDAIIADFQSNIFLYHSGIAPMVNIGLLTPQYVVNEIIKYFNSMTPSNKNKSLHSIEGFIRQIIGWREHCRLTYVVAYDKMLNANKLKAKYQVPESWYSTKPNTGITPLDTALAKGWSNGYLHHIERLMVIGSFMLMASIHPNSAYKWFYHMSCDSYDWNMINNVKIMALYAYPKLYTTKPYIASSHYIMSMSNYKKDGVWDKVWDSLYWEFIRSHKSLIKKNPRLSIQLKNYNNKTPKEKKLYRDTKKSLLASFIHYK